MVVLICISIIIGDAEHLYMCHIYIFFGKMSRPLPIFKIRFVLVVELYKFFIYFGY